MMGVQDLKSEMLMFNQLNKMNKEKKLIQIKWNPPLKKKEFLNWMDENLSMPKEKKKMKKLQEWKKSKEEKKK